MRKKSVRFISAALAACMMASTLPVGAFALEPDTTAENGVSTQAEAVKLVGGETINNAGNYTMSGEYATGITVNTDGDVTITITGPVSIASGSLLKIENVDSLTIENNNNYKVETTETISGSWNWVQGMISIGETNTGTITVNGGVYESLKYSWERPFEIMGGTMFLNDVTVTTSANAVAMVNANVTINGGKYTQTEDIQHPTLWLESGTLTVNNAKVFNCATNTSGIYAKSGTCNLNGGDYINPNGSSAFFQESGTGNINGGTFEGIKNIITARGTATVTIDEKYDKTVIRSAENEAETIAKAGVRAYGTAMVVINGCTIENVEHGVWVKQDTPSVTLKKADFKNNTDDIYLGAGLTIAIEDTFTDTATVKVEDDPITTPRQITTSDTTGQEKLNLVSNDKDASDKTYLVAYDRNSNYRYLTPHAESKYTVTAENATATLDGAPLYSYDEIEAGKDVTMTADAPEEGWVFAGWQVTEGGLTLDDSADTVTFQMPSSNVVVSAQYKYVGTPADPGDNIKGALSAVVVGAAAGAIIYETGTGIYRVINMPGIPMPSNRIELAELLWEHAGKPEPESTEFYSDIREDDTDWQKAARWAVEQDLMQDDADNNKFNPAFPVSKLRVCLTWNAAKEKGLFDKDAE